MAGKLKPMKDAAYFGGKHLEVVTDAAHYGGKYLKLSYDGKQLACETYMAHFYGKTTLAATQRTPRPIQWQKRASKVTNLFSEMGYTCLGFESQFYTTRSAVRPERDFRGGVDGENVGLL